MLYCIEMNNARRGLSLMKYEITGGHRLEGNITISYDENDNINIVLDAKDLNGHSIKTTYTGPSEITEQV